MKKPFIFSLALFLLFAVSPASRAQESPAALVEPQKTEAKEEVVRLLKSGTPRDRAWAAHLCVKGGLVEFLPTLAERLSPETFFARFKELSEYSPTTATPAQHARNEVFLANQAILDALIQLGGRLPAERALPLYELHDDEVIILLLREPEKNQPALFSILNERRLRSRSQKFALYSALIATKSHNGIAHLLKQTAQVHVNVYEDFRDGVPGGIPGGYAGVYASRVGPVIPPDFPPIVFHSLIGESPEKGDQPGTLACGPPVPVYRQMTVRRPGDEGHIGTRDVWMGDDEYTYRFLDALHGGRSRHYQSFPAYHYTILCPKPEQLRPKLAEIHREILKDFADLKRTLFDLNALSKDAEQSLKLRVKLSISDSRRNRTRPLPQIPENYFDAQTPPTR